MLCRMFCKMIGIIYYGHKYLVQDNLKYWQPSFPYFIERYQRLILLPIPVGCNKVGCSWDATIMQIANPGGGYFQRAMYNGKDRVHAIKFGPLNLPNGMFADVQDAEAGARHDEGLMTMSNINARLCDVQNAANVPPNEHMIIYAEKGLMNRSHVRTAFRGNNLDAWQQHENDAMTRPRGVSSEMPFGEVLSESKYISYKKGMKIQLIHSCDSLT